MQPKRRVMVACLALSVWAGAELAIATPATSKRDVRDFVSPYRAPRPQSAGIPEETCADWTDSVPNIPAKLNFQSRYADDDRTRSIVDPDYDRAYREQVRPFREFEERIVEHANDHLRGRPGSAICSARLLHAWARRNALLGIPVNDQGQMVRAWMLASFASAWDQIRSAEGIEASMHKTIDQWVSDLADHVAMDFQPGQAARGKNNNHAYWANWAVAIAAQATQDLMRLEKARERFVYFLEFDVLADGSLEHERVRGARALYYHVYAAGPLFMQAELFRRNRMTNRSNIETINHVIDLIARGVLSPVDFSRQVGVSEKQDLSFMTTSTPQVLHLALCRDPENGLYHRAYQAYLKANGHDDPPVVYTRLGGDVSLLRTCGTKTAKTALQSYVLK